MLSSDLEDCRRQLHASRQRTKQLQRTQQQGKRQSSRRSPPRSPSYRSSSSVFSQRSLKRKRQQQKPLSPRTLQINRRYQEEMVARQCNAVKEITRVIMLKCLQYRLTKDSLLQQALAVFNPDLVVANPTQLAKEKISVLRQLLNLMLNRETELMYYLNHTTVKMFLEEMRDWCKKSNKWNFLVNFVKHFFLSFILKLNLKCSER